MRRFCNGFALPIYWEQLTSLGGLLFYLSKIDNIDMQVEGKEKLKDSETILSNLAKLALEQADLSVIAASKWMELGPVADKLYDDVNNLINKASDIKMKLLS